MKIFSSILDEDYYTITRNTYIIKFKIDKLPDGIVIRGKIKGKAGLVKVFEDDISGNLFINNWQSWGKSKIINPEENYKKIEYDKNKYMIHLTPSIYSKNLVSDYFLASKNKLVGFLSSKIAHGFFTIKDNNVQGYLNFFGKSFEEYTDIEPLIVIENEKLENLLENYAEYVKIENNVKIKNEIPFGWSSWYQYYDKLRWEDVRKNLRLSSKYNYKVFQIDDSWQKDIGDWETRESWPSLKEIAGEIKNHGFIPGIWLAPFSVSETSRIFCKHPDWVIKNPNESPKISYINWKKNIYALDTSNPEVKEYIKYVFNRLKKAGFKYFKIDFLFAGAIPGKRHLENITPIEAYREGLATIRKSVEDSFVLGCGAPLLPSLGFVDGMRVSEDTAPLYVVDSKIKLNAYNAIKNSINRYFMNKKWWINDPDCLILRKEKSGLKKKIVELYSYISGILNYMIFQSDDLSLNIYDEILFKALKYRGGKTSVRGLETGKYKITSIHPTLGKIELEVNLEKAEYSLTVENTKNLIEKKTVLKEDGRLFHFYEGKENKNA